MTKYKFYRNIISLLLVSLSSNSIKAQVQIDSLLNILDTKFPQEKVYLHLDKAYYSAGETIWFKAYLAADNLPEAFSTTLYAELLDDHGTILQRKMFYRILPMCFRQEPM